MSRQAIGSPQGVPCLPPPWGELVAVNLSNGTIRWYVPLGTAVKLEGKTFPVSRHPESRRPDPHRGGPCLHRFVDGQMDISFRAFDVDTGQVLWTVQLPAGGQATPMTFQENGRLAVCGHLGGRPRRVRHDAWGCSCSFRAALIASRFSSQL